ncbi:hypothetical protein LOZ39_004280 [Ophidiomyces ophidiicola]|nr:hypothetical protein LOZ64_005091 [Ophidiomyces ophidiicola]KAI2007439.1 hypothetical protein LOZ50_002538 [Ophidiomyces ophidiicola]KAI2009843.1 hypothetical protein LOZ49_003732 [Ophidiomyces ophidiicola]KAI2019491.1 hypothetical protein LOZ46_003315 [Ophidiomyces ophidiicola]KAI2036106.1 hypothetical protein LOZ45_000113 [Ophidiomyces ophidiicola]
MISYRSSGLFTVIVFFAILLLILSSTPDPAKLTASIENSAGQLAEYVPNPKLPKFDDFKFHLLPPTAHKPPEEKNSTGGGSKWYSNWQWRNPFSSSITLDENRSVLPPLRLRPPIYTYYDSTSKKDKDVIEADKGLLLAWRRAWFAQGFRPVILGPQDAMKNQLYKVFNTKGLDEHLVVEFMAWLAWSHMGNGILADWQCFPMAHYDDTFLSYLRRGSMPEKIIRVEGLGSALFSGEKTHIIEATKQVADNLKIKEAKSIIELLSEDTFKVEKTAALAHYNSTTITSKYPSVAERLDKSPSQGRSALVDLINTHLQISFQSEFSSGLSVLKPFPDYTSALVSPGVRLATLLSECLPIQMPPSCPPNNPKCQLCNEASRMKISQPDGYKNDSALFTIGILPHPYTLVTLKKGDNNITITYIRRETKRDPWLIAATKHYLGTERDSTSRVSAFKDVVAGDHGLSRGIWFTVETLPAKSEEESLPLSVLDDLDWHFGFKVPRKTRSERAKEATASKQKSQRNLPAEAPVAEKKSKLGKENELIETARELLKNDPKDIHIKAVTEAWNLADTEVWRFVRAYRARSVVERQAWEEEEKGFAGS